MRKQTAYAILIILVNVVAHSASIQLRSIDSLKNEITIQQGDLIDLEVFVDVGEIPSAGVETYLTYEPGKLRLVNNETPFQQGKFYTGTIVLNKAVSQTEVGFAVISNAAPYPKGRGAVAKIQFIGRIAGETKVTFNRDPQTHWRQGRYTLFTQFKDGKPRLRSFKDLTDANIEIKNTLVKIDRYELQRFVSENPGKNIPLDKFVVASGTEGRPKLNWVLNAEDGKGRPRKVELNAANQLIVGNLLPRSKGEVIKVDLRVSLKVGDSLAIDTATVWLDNKGIPVLIRFPEVRFRAGSEEILLLDNFVKDRDHKNAELRWAIEGMPTALVVGGVSVNRLDRTKGTIDNPPRLTFRSLNPVASEQNFKMYVTAMDPDENFDRGELKVTVEPLPFVKLDLTLPNTISLIKNEEHHIDLSRYLDVEPREVFDEIAWEALPSEHIEVIIKNRILTLRPQRDWVGTAEKIKIVAKFEGKKVDEASMTVSIFDLPEEATKTFPVILVRNPIIRTEFKIVSVLDNVAALTVGLTFPESPDLKPKTLMMGKIAQSRNVWVVNYELEKLPVGGVKIVASVIGRDNLNQNITPSAGTFTLK